MIPLSPHQVKINLASALEAGKRQESVLQAYRLPKLFHYYNCWLSMHCSKKPSPQRHENSEKRKQNEKRKP